MRTMSGVSGYCPKCGAENVVMAGSNPDGLCNRCWAADFDARAAIVSPPKPPKPQRHRSWRKRNHR